MSKYIDVEALGIGMAREEIFANPEFAQGWNNAIEIINNVPAADVTPVVHGQWIGIDSSFWKPTHSGGIPVFRKTYRCSECGRRTAIAENYCPNCGAKMDKEETNELD